VQPPSDESVDAALAAIGRLETLPDAQELIGLTHPNGSFVTLR
jgi:hypothetical protein